MCGVFGIRSPERDVARLAYFGLYALQHRGQESAGIAVSDGGRLTVLREMGLVTQVFSEREAARPARRARDRPHALLDDRLDALGERAAARAPRPRAATVALGHNGNLVNAAELREELAERGVRSRSTSDTELIAALIARRRRGRSRRPSRGDGAARRRVLVRRARRGPSSSPSATRTASGRSASAGSASDWVVASETCALDLVGAEFVREVRRGELVVVDGDGLRSIQAVPPDGGGALCIFEFFYLARPDSRLAGVEVHAARVRMGERLAEEAPVEADLVLPIPDSGTPAAIGFSRATGIPFSEGLIKNRYVGRTFIQPDQELREQGIRLKFNPLAEVAGKRVVVVDDSIVRGNTTRQIVRDALRRRRGRGARARLVAAGRRRRASTASTSPTRTSSSRRSARSRRCASTSARRASPTSRSRVCRATRRPAVGALPRLPDAATTRRRVPADAGKAPLRAGLALDSTARARGSPSRRRG